MPAGQPDAGQADLSDYAHHDWVLPHARWTCHEMVIRACAAAGFTPRAVATATDFAVQLALVRAGVGVALVPGLACIALPAEVTLYGLWTPACADSIQPGLPKQSVPVPIEAVSAGRAVGPRFLDSGLGDAEEGTSRSGPVTGDRATKDSTRSLG